jgi:hypothetical protein
MPQTLPEVEGKRKVAVPLVMPEDGERTGHSCRSRVLVAVPVARMGVQRRPGLRAAAGPFGPVRDDH